MIIPYIVKYALLCIVVPYFQIGTWLYDNVRSIVLKFNITHWSLEVDNTSKNDFLKDTIYARDFENLFIPKLLRYYNKCIYILEGISLT